MMFTQTDRVDADRVARLAATLGVEIGSTLPALWHWILFLDPIPANQLRADGHRAEGGIIPIDPHLPARMWAGSRTELCADIAIGASLHRGILRVVTVHHDVFSDHGLVLREDQDFVYLEAGLPRPTPPLAPPPPPDASRRTVIPDEILLFRFSALTFNAHRIHYDRTYATGVERYPDLVVHGPLQAILLAGHLNAACPGGAIRTFDCRALAPAFVGRQLQLEAWHDPGNPVAWTLQTRDPSGVICMQARAVIQPAATAPGTAE
jgi:3-methylfumaryl-CoA hydratase